MWQNLKYYVVAYLIVAVGVLVSTGLQLLESLFPEISPLNKLAANLSGISLGTVIMVVGLIRDKRFTDAQSEANKQRQRADKAEAAIGQANNRAETAEAEAEAAIKRAREQVEQVREQERQQAEEARQRAEKAEAELARMQAKYEAEVLARIRRLEEFTGMTAPEREGEDAG